VTVEPVIPRQEPRVGTRRREPMTRRLILAALLIISLLVAGCGGAGTDATPAPSTPVAPSLQPVTTQEEAVAAVIAREPRLTGITEFDPELIGQGTYYEVTPASGVGAFLVKVTVGWGDCPAGCINRHEWLYAVQPDGTVVLQTESGDPVPNDVWPSPGGDGRTGILLTAVAGPVCPVETNPPEPECAPRPVPGAVVIVRDVAGDEVTRATLDAGGFAFVELPAGTYSLEAEAAPDLMGAPEPQSVTVSDGAAVPITLEYDTGIR
jgi:hypothetical protein